MNQQNILELAKQGDANAIASLINRQLQPKGITAKASLKNGCLNIMLESAQVPNQQTFVTLMRKGITSLGAAAIERVKVYGRQAGEEFPAWSQEFELAGQPSSNSRETQFATANVKIQQQQPSLKERAKQGDVDAITKLLNTALKLKNITAKANLQDGCLSVMLESDQVPDEQTSIRIIRREITNLKSEFLKSVKFYGKQTGDEFPSWNQDIDLGTQELSTLISKNSSLPHKSDKVQGLNYSLRLTPGKTTAGFTHNSSSVYDILIEKLTGLSLDSLNNLQFSTIALLILSFIIVIYYLISSKFIFLFFAICVGLIPAKIASDKGKNFINWWCYGFLLPIVALIHALTLKQDESKHSSIQSGFLNPDAANTGLLLTGCFIVGLITLGVVSDIWSIESGILNLIFTGLLALIPAKVASDKGRSFLNWWCYGFMLLIVAIFHAIVIKEDEQIMVKKGIVKECPSCAEIIKVEAKVCRYCGHKFIASNSPNL